METYCCVKLCCIRLCIGENAASWTYIRMLWQAGINIAHIRLLHIILNFVAHKVTLCVCCFSVAHSFAGGLLGRPKQDIAARQLQPCS